jgi:hypothetical protein
MSKFSKAFRKAGRQINSEFNRNADVIGKTLLPVPGVTEAALTGENLKNKAEEAQRSAEEDARNADAAAAAIAATTAAEIEAARKKRILEASQRGRRGSILTGASGLESELGYVNRPRAATLLGQTTELGG